MTSSNKTLLIMAAGNGSRYGALKQFDNLGPNKEFLFEFSLFDALKNGFDHVVIITKDQFVAEIREYLQSRIPKTIKIDVIAQRIADLPSSLNKNFSREKPWGTAHAVWVARNHIDNNFVVINADDFYGRDAFEKAAQFIQSHSSDNVYGLVPYSLEDTLSDHGTVSRGICQVQNHSLKSIKELTKIGRKETAIIDFSSNATLTGEEPTSMNLWICNPSIFKEIEMQLVDFLSVKENIESGEMYIPLVIQKLIDDKSVTVKLTSASASWFGVTYAADKESAIQSLNEMALNEEYPSPLWKN